MSTNQTMATKERKLNTPIAPRVLYRQGIKHVWGCRPASMLPWMSIAGPSAYIISSLSPSDILGIMRNEGKDDCHCSQPVPKSEIQFGMNDNYDYLTEAIFDPTPETRKYGHQLAMDVLELIKLRHGSLTGYIHNQMKISGPVCTITKFRAGELKKVKIN